MIRIDHKYTNMISVVARPTLNYEDDWNFALNVFLDDTCDLLDVRH